MNSDATTKPSMITTPVVVSVRKKLSIFTSATIPYGPPRNDSIWLTDISATTYRNNPIRMYFNDRRGMSTHFGGMKFLRNSFFPTFARYSENVPTGQSQLQKLLRSNQEIRRNAMSKRTPAG